MTRGKRDPAPKVKWSLWMPVAVLERLKQRSAELTRVRGRRVSVSELVVRACRSKRSN